MARPYSEGRLQYFPMDCVMNDAMRLLEAEFGLTGFAVVVKLWQKIYAGRGYYCEWTNEVALVFAQDVGLGANAVSEILGAALRRGIFDREIFDRYHVLTSDGIQRRYFEAVKRRKKIEVDERYLLVKVAHTEVNANINEVNADINEVNADINPQSKVKESKVKESILNESSAPEGAAAAKQKQIREIIKQHPQIIIPEDKIYRLVEEINTVRDIESYIAKLANFLDKKGAQVQNHCETIIKWFKEDNEQTSVKTGRYDFEKIKRERQRQLEQEYGEEVDVNA